MKAKILNYGRWAAVVVCTILCMVLTMAEPVTEGHYSEWMVLFVAMKAAGIVCGAVALGLAGKLRDILKVGAEETEK